MTDIVLPELDEQIDFQRRWRRITSFSYFTGASLSVIAAAAATVVAGLGYAAAAAVVAALATIATSLEKVLLFREKWTHHRAIETDLELLRLRYRAHKVDEEHAISEFERIVRRYGSNMPLAGTTEPAE
jgi:Protein of unknown function (DUF4231)